jgi:Flp pilus assembly protein TadB
VIVGTNIIAKARRAREVFRFIRINSSAYLSVFHSDLSSFQDELVRTSGGLIVGAVAGLLFVSFLSVALLVSAWETKLRLVAAWGVTAGWLIIALTGLTYARRALRAPMPFANFTQLVQRGLSAIERAEP